ncbi:MAG: lysophospholipid acyltransferase family protein [Deltaproteobacteria bacterium]|nr:lysophospholipid acyltransferase family protein [Deltaproteobacteria bacterium]
MLALNDRWHSVPGVPPTPTVADILRSLRLFGVDIGCVLLEMALHRTKGLTTTTDEGIALLRQRFASSLERAGVDSEVFHADRVPATGGVVVMWNQASHLDHLTLVVAMPRSFFTLYNNEVARFPFYGDYLRNSGHFHVDRTDEQQWRASVESAAARVRAGACVLVSPEGTRSMDGHLLPMKRGAFLLAVGSGRPIVCATVVGGHERMPRGSPFVRAGRQRVVFSSPLALSTDVDALQAAVVETFERTLVEFRLDEQK